MIKLTTETFIQKAKKVHGDKYDYSLVDYIDSLTKVKIICPIHGVFEIRAGNHIYGQGCYFCGFELISSKNLGKKIKSDPNKLKNIFIQKAVKKYGNKYDYSKIKYIDYNTKIEIICNIHGSFFQTPVSHLKSFGCEKCTRNIPSLESFINESNKIHNNIYSYEKVTDIKSKSDYILIKCNIHGYFKQKIKNHLKGCGCQRCKSSKGEMKIESILINNLIHYEKQKYFNDCRLLKKRPLFFDFYLPNYNMCIEYDGEQHFKPISVFGGNSAYEKIILADNFKNEYCKNNNIELIRIKYDENIDEKLKFLNKKSEK